MSSSPERKQHLRTLNIICAAIVSGIVALGVVVYVLLRSGTLGPDPSVSDLTGMVINLMALAVLVVAQFLPRQLPRPGAGASGAEVFAWHKKTIIIATALREGAAFLALVGILLTGSWSPGIGVVVLAVLLILLGWPRETQLQEYLRR
jgi:hypothetical protein